MKPAQIPVLAKNKEPPGGQPRKNPLADSLTLRRKKWSAGMCNAVLAQVVALCGND